MLLGAALKKEKKFRARVDDSGHTPMAQIIYSRKIETIKGDSCFPQHKPSLSGTRCNGCFWV